MRGRAQRRSSTSRAPSTSSREFFDTHCVLRLHGPAGQRRQTRITTGRCIEAKVGGGSSEEGVFLKAAGPGEVP